MSAWVYRDKSRECTISFTIEELEKLLGLSILSQKQCANEDLKLYAIGLEKIVTKALFTGTLNNLINKGVNKNESKTN